MATRPTIERNEREWAERAACHLKAEMKRADVTYEALAERLKVHWLRGDKGEHHEQAGARDRASLILSSSPSGLGNGRSKVGRPLDSIFSYEIRAMR